MMNHDEIVLLLNEKLYLQGELLRYENLICEYDDESIDYFVTLGKLAYVEEYLSRLEILINERLEEK